MADHENRNKRLETMRRDLMTFGERFPSDDLSPGDAETAQKIAFLADEILFSACCDVTRRHALAVIARARSFVYMSRGQSLVAIQWATRARELEEELAELIKIFEKAEAQALEAFIGNRPPKEEMN